MIGTDLILKSHTMHKLFRIAGVLKAQLDGFTLIHLLTCKHFYILLLCPSLQHLCGKSNTQ